MLDIEEFGKKIDKKSRLLGIDPGKKRVGIAICDENKIIATPYTTIIKNNFLTKDMKIDFYNEMFDEKDNNPRLNYCCIWCRYNFIFVTDSYPNTFLTRVNPQ